MWGSSADERDIGRNEIAITPLIGTDYCGEKQRLFVGIENLYLDMSKGIDTNLSFLAIVYSPVIVSLMPRCRSKFIPNILRFSLLAKGIFPVMMGMFVKHNVKYSRTKQ